MRSPRYWPGYRLLNHKDGTTIFKPTGSTRLENGLYRLRNIGIGLPVSLEVILLGQPCFATEVPELAKPLLGKREDTRGERYG